MKEERPSAAILPFRRRPKSRTYRQRVADALEWLEDQRERLVGELDAIDGDPDIEEDDPPEDNGDAEPALGFREPPASLSQIGNLIGPIEDDREAEHDGREPSLGFSEPAIPCHPWGTPRVNQLRLWEGARDDREDEHDGREETPTKRPVESERPSYPLKGTPDDPLPVWTGPLQWWPPNR